MSYAVRLAASAGIASGLDTLAGIWLLISPFVLGFTSVTGAMVHNVVLGLAIGILSAIRYSKPAQNIGLSWLNVALGFWLLISPWCVGFSVVPSATVNNMMFGIVVISLASLSGSAASNEM